MPTLGSASRLPTASSLLLYQTLALWSQAELGNSQPVPGPIASGHRLPFSLTLGAPRHDCEPSHSLGRVQGQLGSDSGG